MKKGWLDLQRLGIAAKGAALIVAVGMLGATPAGNGPYATMTALESRRSLGDGELALFLDSPNERVAVRAALAIGRTKQAAGEPLLAAHLRDPRDAVRAMSFYAMGLLATGADPAALLAALSDANGAVRIGAVDATARYEAARQYAPPAERAAQGGIEGVLARDRDPIVRARAATALAEFRSAADDAEAADALSIAFRQDPDRDVRWHAMWSIYRAFALKTNRHLVESALADPDELVRIEAVRAMSRYKDPKLVALVMPLLADPSWRVAEQAAETVRILQGKPPHDHWTAIPAYVHLPPRRPDPLASLPALPRDAVAGPLAAPTAQDAILEPRLDPTTSREMTEPARGAHPRVRIVTTKGNLYVTLFPEWAPLTVANFLGLANRGYYDRNRWFRIVPDFVVQTGDPNDNGNGDAGFTIGAEENPVEQRSYVISMGMDYDTKANLPIRDSAGTQYYITLSPQLHLDRSFSVYGEVTGGTDVLARLVESDRVVRIERIADVLL
jgi:peptidyl-prolyl cis-trans isomerase B (cyclophilin B)